VDARFLQSLVGFNARMASLKIIGLFVPRMAQFGLRVVDFSILSLIRHNPGITSRQLCDALNLLPPNLVGKIGALERRGLLQRHPHPWTGGRKACC
jgi:DNA-binding MarR family transcriptional regulator